MPIRDGTRYAEHPYVDCDTPEICTALCIPVTEEEHHAAMEHWAYHSLWGGCAHE